MGLKTPESNPGYEKQDLQPRKALLFFIGLIGLLVIAHYVALRVFDYLSAQRIAYPPPPALAEVREPFVGPRLLVDQAANMEKLRQSEEVELQSYGWIDRDRGVVQIPIDRAMELLSHRGLPEKISTP